MDTSGWLTVGRTYDVLEVLFVGGSGWLLRLIGDGGNGVALFQLDLFEIMDARVPPNWIATWGSDGGFRLCPERWSHSSFWERFYDREPEAIQVFEEEKVRTVG
ncbi:MAG TPA: hypothetical protein VFE08_04855 [Candidatus Sulfotelmatobacter sp.]|jgi:hypothetical protein|nr:hypothetical protein [Candidatus Sulfotelmatobacter sp.]